MASCHHGGTAVDCVDPRDCRVLVVGDHPTQPDRDGLSGYRAEAADDARDLHVLAGCGRRTRGPTGHARNECVHNLRTVAARAAALHAVVVH